MTLTERIAAAKPPEPKDEPPRVPLWVQRAKAGKLPVKVYR